MSVEELDELGEVGKRTGQAVDLVDDDDVDAPLANALVLRPGPETTDCAYSGCQ